MREFVYDGVRATENPIVNVQLGTDPMVTQLVLGQPQAVRFPGMEILRPISVDAWTFKYTVYGKEHLGHFDTRRGMRAPIRHTDWKVSTVTEGLERYSFSTVRDQDELNNAAPSLAVRERSATLSRRIVEMDIERKIRDLLLDSTTGYAANHIITLGAGNEWDDATNGDSKASIRTLSKQIAVDTGLQPADMHVFLPMAALEAAKDDPTFLAIRANWTSDISDEMALAKYWGVGRVWSANPVEIDTSSPDDVVAMYGDTAIVYYPGDAAGYDTTYGDLHFGATFKWNKGVASTPWYDNKTTSWYFPWTDYAKEAVTNYLCGGLVLNTSSLV